MKTKFLILSLFVINLVVSGQAKFLDVPKLDINDVKSTAYTKNPEEVAEVLYKSFHYWIEDTGNLRLDVVSRVKIYKKDQAEKFLNQEIYTYQGKGKDGEVISSLKVTTYNVDGDKIIASNVDRSSKYKSKENKYFNITKFAFENVKDGSVLEYKYSIVSPFYWNIKKVTVEEEIPTRYFEYVFDHPKYLGYNLDYKGELAPKVREVGDKHIYGGEYYSYRFGYVNIEPYKDEKYVNNISNYRTSIRAELNSSNITRYSNNYGGGVEGGYKSYAVSWNDIRKQLYDYENFGGELKRKSLVKDVLPQNIKDISSKEEKAAEILKFVQKNYTWNGDYDYSSDDGKGLRNLLNTKIGNSGEINLLLIMLMRSAGLEAEPIVIATIGRGLLLDYSPSINQLNYVIAALEIDNKFFIYDANSKLSTPNLIRPAALNYNGYLMTSKEAKKINLSNPEKSVTYLTVDAKLNPNGSFSGNFSDRDTRLYAMMNQERYNEDKALYQNKYYKERYKFPFSNIKTEMLDNNEIQTSFDFDADSFVDGIGGKMVFNPLLFLYNSKHDFDQTTERRSPIELITGYDKIKKVTITLPEGYVFENVPKPKKFRTDDNVISYLYNVKQEGNKLTVETIVTVEDSDYPKEYYPAFKQIFDNITKLEGQVVTAVKK